MARRKMQQRASTPDISAVLNLHREGGLSIPSMRSLALCVETARAAGISVECLAILDRPDPLTVQAVQVMADVFNHVHEIDAGDLGRSRNAAVRLSKGRHVGFFDADDLWGEAWLQQAWTFAQEQHTQAQPEPMIIFHPEYAYYFSTRDFPRQSTTDTPPASTNSYHLHFIDSDAPEFDRRAIFFANLYTSNSFARRDVYVQYPYRGVERHAGFGVEDWAWNAETLAAGVRHAVVPETVHLVRYKERGSLSHENVAQGLLPPLHFFTEMLWQA